MSGEMDGMSWKEKEDCMNILESLAQAYVDRAEIWEPLAKEIGAQFNRDRLRQGAGIGRVVCLVVEEWFISLKDTESLTIPPKTRACERHIMTKTDFVLRSLARTCSPRLESYSGCRM